MRCLAMVGLVACTLLLPAPAPAQAGPFPTWTQDDLLRWAPQVHLHPNCRYLPSAVDPFYLRELELVERDAGAERVVAESPSPELLGSYLGAPKDKAYLRVAGGHPDDVLNDVYRGEPLAPAGDGSGERVTAPMYVHVLPGPDGAFLDLQYIFFYPYSGPQVLRIGLAESDDIIGLCSGTSKWTIYWPPFATHEGDFEHVTVRVTPDFQDVIAVYTDAHGSSQGRWWYPDDPVLNWVEGTHVKVYSALHTHASYPFEDDGITLEEAPAEALVAAGPFTCGPITCGFFGGIHWLNFADVTRNGDSRLWRPWDGSPLIELRFGEDGVPENGQDWLGFPGRYGAKWDPDVFDVGFPRLACKNLEGCSNAKNCAGEALTQAFDIADWLGKVDEDKLGRNGPSLATPGSWFFEGDIPLVLVDRSDFDVPSIWGGRGYNWLGDLDGDGVDEIVSGRGSQVAVKWHRGGVSGFSGGEFGIDGIWGGEQFTWLADYDGDGREEIVTARGNTLHIKRLTGRGALRKFEFETHQLLVANYNSGWWNWMGDLDGDGQDEIVSGSGNTVWVKWYRKNRGDWRQTTHLVSTPWGGEGGNWVVDLEGDGIDEIVSAVGGNIHVKRYADGQFTSDEPYPLKADWTGNFSNWAGDLDGDGLLDIVSSDGSRLFVKRFNGTGFEASSVPGITGWGPHGLDTWMGDLNGDGWDSVVSANAGKVFVKEVAFQPSGIEIEPAPEPSADLLGAVALGALATLRRRRSAG